MKSGNLWWLACALASVLGCSVAQPEPDASLTPDDVVYPPVDNPPPSCPRGEVLCGDTCVNTTANNTHCGRCGNTCPNDQSCTAGACTSMMPTCPAGQTACGDACVDTTTSVANCGSCGNACPADQMCIAGTCSAPPSCPAGQTSCAGTCVDTASDATHCGDCATACPAGQSCDAGRCVAPMTCPAGQSLCAGTCVSTQTDPANCGRCGTTCSAGQMCTRGACTAAMCPSGQTLCGASCVNTSTDATNCGACGRSCAAGQTCSAGTCTGSMSGCPAGQTMCGSVCADLTTDPANCGRCGTTCSAGMACMMGACASVMACPTGQTLCGASCVNTATDRANCGSCANACEPGQTCQSGACACAAGQTLCGRACVNTATDAANCGSCANACARGQSCVSSRCATTCPTGQTLCGGTCVNTSTDAANCGSCANACPMGQTCTTGRCGCPTGQTLCSGACFNTQTDRAHCGSCTTACTSGQTCILGRCACATGQIVCAGACVDAQSDARNCGACANACPAGQACAMGRCGATPPPNDTRAGATDIPWTTATTTLTANTSSARNDTTGACGCTSGNDVFYRFALTQPEYVYADTLGATWDTSLFFQTSAGGNIPAPTGSGQLTCNDDRGFCATGVQSQIAARLGPGTYYLVLSGCGSGAATVHVQHLPAGNGSNTLIAPSATVQTASGTTSGTGTTNAACCSGGPENSYWWVTCPGAAATSFHATNCTGTHAYDSEIDQRSALRTGTAASVCNDDVTFACGTGSSINATIPATAAAEAGLNTLTVDSCIGSGAYAVQYVMANCTTGTRCGAACVNTATDASHCGGCNRQCAAGQLCRAGMCLTPPANDQRAGATVVSLTASSQILSADTTAASNHTTGGCSCTSGNDVFFRFTLTQTEMVYADTVGATWDTSLFFQNSAGANLTTAGVTNGAICNDDGGILGCATGLQSQVVARLTAGTYYLVLSGCSAGAASVRFQHLPVGNGTTSFLSAGTTTISGTTSGTGVLSATCCSGGPENTYYWVSCQASAGGTFTASTCGRATWDTELDQRSAARTQVAFCNDDSCALQSSLSSVIPAGPGLHTLTVDGCGSGAGTYTATVTRP